MIIRFYKYHGTGNDFILIDNRSKIIRNYSSKKKLIAQLCNRHFGIGADGLMLINSHESYDFEMVYFNSDGNEGSMCGNGGRCIVAFAHLLGLVNEKAIFTAIDGIHEASIVSADKENLIVRLKMADVTKVKKESDHYQINTGSPHYVKFVENPDKIDIVEAGRKIRYNKSNPEGTNVNFVGIEDHSIYVRTYERGVEDETLSCGTGVTASAIVSFLNGNFSEGNINIKTRGGDLHVDFEHNQGKFENVWLTGPATFVFKGEIII